MLNRKRIFAIVLFVLIGLFVYTFANPAEDLEPLDNKDNTEDVEKKDAEKTDDVIQLPDDNDNIIPVIVNATNYGVLRTAVENGNVVLNLKTEDQKLSNLLVQLENATNNGQQLITNQINDQNLVNNGANTINQLLTQISTLLTENLGKTIKEGNRILNYYVEMQNLNSNLQDLLEDLSDEIDGAEGLENPTAQQMLQTINKILGIIIKIEDFQADLDMINLMSLRLVPSTTNWTNQDLTLTAEYDIENPNLIDDITIVRGSTCGIEESNSQFSTVFENLVMQAINTEELIVSENDDYTACVTFTNGELKSATYSVGNIDKKAPVVTLTNLKTVYLEAGIDTYQEYGSSATDDYIAPEELTFRQLIEYTTDNKYFQKVSNVDNTKIGRYKIWYYYKDKSGNEGNAIRNVYVKDTKSPIATFEPNGSVDWKNRVTFNVTAEDKGSNIIIAKSKWSQSTTAPTEKQFVTDLKDTYLTPKNYNGEWYLWIYLEDEYGNKSFTSSNAFKLDNTYPIVDGVEDGKAYNKNVLITVLEENIASITSNGTPITIDGLNQYKFRDNGNYSLVVTDKAGNITTINFIIDKEAPNILVNEKEVKDFYNNSYVVIKVTDNNLKTVTGKSDGISFPIEEPVNGVLLKTVSMEKTYEITAIDEAGNTTTKTFTMDRILPEVSGVEDGKAYNKNVLITVLEENIASITSNGTPITIDGLNQYKFRDNGNYSLVVTDKAGNITTINFIIDKEAPNILVNEKEVKDFYNNSGSVVIKVTDTNLKTVTGKSDGISFPIEEPVNGVLLKTVSMEKTYEITAIDEAGNTTTKTFTMDRILPEVSGVEDGKAYNKNVLITVLEKNVASVTSNGNPITIDGLNQYKFRDNGNYSLVVTDKAGNITTINFIIDKEAPVGTIELSPSELTNGNVIVTLTTTEPVQDIENWLRKSSTVFQNEYSDNTNGIVTVNFTDLAGNPGSATYSVSNIDKVAPAGTVELSPSEPTNGNVMVTLTTTEPVQDIASWLRKSSTVFQKAYGDNTNGIVTVNLIDLAGNPGSVTYSVSNIDKIIPTATFTYSNNNGLDFTASDVTVTLTASEDIQDITGWNKVDSKTFTSVYSENNEYSLEIKDLVGNPNTVNYEVRGIDKVAPVITGVENNGLYKEDVTYNIVEINIEKVIIDDVEYNEIPSDRTITTDSIHTIQVIDKAGNSAFVKFTIDKTLPVVSTLTQKYADGKIKVEVQYSEPVIGFLVGDTDDTYWRDLGGNLYYRYYTGTQSATLNFEDLAGNPNIYTFDVDNTAPVPNVSNLVLTKENGENYDLLTDVSSDDPTATIVATVNEIQVDNVNKLNTVGTYTVTYTATDEIGNYSTATAQLTLKANFGAELIKKVLDPKRSIVFNAPLLVDILDIYTIKNVALITPTSEIELGPIQDIWYRVVYVDPGVELTKEQYNLLNNSTYSIKIIYKNEFLNADNLVMYYSF